MKEKFIGFVYRFAKNDYEILLTKLSEEDQEKLYSIIEKYLDDDARTTCERGGKNLSLNDVNVDWFENGKEWEE